uniref:ATP synthase complex subunit 8 n=1 Tax=Platypodinae sp. BMNH 1274715 TaxID=2558031 RepID=A0A126TEC4_9CUCU|nr:ATP synthase F0 subunit 8 [Platypodinae sp. BMNH 1274715]
MPQMAPYNWSLYLTLIIMFFVLTVLTNYFSNLSNTKSSTSQSLKPKSLNWKW